MIEAKFPPFTYTHPEYTEPPEKVLTVCCGEPTPLDGDWKEWDGSADLPPDLSPEDEVDVLFRGTPMEERPFIKGYGGRTWCWRHVFGAGDIVAYRKAVKKEEPPQQQTTTSQYQVGGDHYTSMAIQPWDAAKAWYGPVEYLGYHLITANAYLARHKSKGGLQDIKKARHHLDELIRYFEEDEDYPY